MYFFLLIIIMIDNCNKNLLDILYYSYVLKKLSTFTYHHLPIVVCVVFHSQTNDREKFLIRIEFHQVENAMTHENKSLMILL